MFVSEEARFFALRFGDIYDASEFGRVGDVFFVFWRFGYEWEHYGFLVRIVFLPRV